MNIALNIVLMSGDKKYLDTNNIKKHSFCILYKLTKKDLPGMGIEPMLTIVNWILSPTP